MYLGTYIDINILLYNIVQVLPYVFGQNRMVIIAPISYFILNT